MTAPGSFDWAAIRARLERSARMADPDADDPERSRALLRARAATLAREQAPGQTQPTGEGDGDALQVLAFELGGARYALETAFVAQASTLPALTALPGLPNHVAGIAAFRGRVLAVLDLRPLLALPVTRLTEPTALLVLQGESMEFALLADTIAGVQHYSRAAMSTAIPGLGAQRAGYLLGVAPDRTAILDARRMLADRSLVIHGR